MILNRTLVAATPAEMRDDADAMFAAIGWGGSNFNTPMTETGDSISHYAMSAVAAPGIQAWLEGRGEAPAGIDGGQDAVIDALQFRFCLSVPGRTTLERVCGEWGLYPFEPVNVNSDGLERLKILPGVGDVTGQAIIDGRPWSDVEEISDVSGVSAARIIEWIESGVVSDVV